MVSPFSLSEWAKFNLKHMSDRSAHTHTPKMFYLKSTLGAFIELILLFWGCATVKTAATFNDRPIIGILAQDTNSPYGKTYISATYVKFMEQAGARVVPIRGGQPLEYYGQMVNYTNGILIPGGSVNLNTSLLGRSARIIYDLVIQANDRGDYYPLWGTCMGFQVLCFLTQGENLLKGTDSNNASWPLNFTSGFRKSRMFGYAPEEIIQILAQQPVTQNEHSYSILLPDFENSKLSKFFSKLSTNLDRKGKEFISTVEAKNYPIYGVQWHPEKNNFNWNPNYVINHNRDAVKVSQYMSDFFVNESRKNLHKFPTVHDEAVNMIQNFKRVYYPDNTFFDFYFPDL
ncbi:gamma-glutamyl hydrolase A-like isoform X2 [Biomphalaria glabrata]|uniref:folate gamma-glutamyl hydrolase n=1 Tax=Biomphalaria glabrata TaxID=6526 RepID=A0A9W2ZPL0_BIOGL|nr:gamma-glutamyl hydrolase A-like isoform X2 [Biomphalaria glabrata]